MRIDGGGEEHLKEGPARENTSDWLLQQSDLGAAVEGDYRKGSFSPAAAIGMLGIPKKVLGQLEELYHAVAR